LQHELDLELARHHLALRLGIEPDMAHHDLAEEPRFDELADPLSGHGGVIGADGQIPLALAENLVDEALGRADGHEAADHEARAVRDEGDGLLEREGAHLSASLPGNLAIQASHLCPKGPRAAIWRKAVYCYRLDRLSKVANASPEARK